MTLRGALIRFGPVLAMVSLSACTQLPRNFARHQGVAPYAPTNFTAGPAIPAEIRRVVLLPLDRAGHATPEVARELDGILRNALQQQNRFEVVTLSREDCRRMFGAESFDSSTALPNGFVAKVGEKFAAEAVLFVDLTGYRYMRPLMVGFRAKLAVVDDSRIIWAFDEQIDAATPGVEAAVKAHYADLGDPVSMADAALLSPSRFDAFAATSMFSTLPGR